VSRIWFCDRYKTKLEAFAPPPAFAHRQRSPTASVVTSTAVQRVPGWSHTLVALAFMTVHKTLCSFSQKIVCWKFSTFGTVIAVHS